MDVVALDLRSHEFFGFIPAKFCAEVQAIIYNEFLEATKCIEDKLAKSNPSKAEEIHTQLTSFLVEVDNELSSSMELLLQYFYYNYIPDPSMTLHGADVAGSAGATERVQTLRLKLSATNQLNSMLLERISFLEKEIEKRHALIAKLKEQKAQVFELQQAMGISLELKNEAELALQ